MKSILAAREFPVTLALALVIVLTGLANSEFLSRASLRDIFMGAAVTATLAVGQTFVIVMKHIDISVGSTAGFVAFLVGRSVTEGQSLVVAISIGLFVGILIGVFNGVLVAYLGLPSLVVTLGSLYAVRGIFNSVAGGITITADNLPSALLTFGSHMLLGIPYLFYTAIVLVIIAAIYMRYFTSGRDLYAIGSNLSAAGLAGIPTAKRTFGAFVLNSFIAAIAGVVLLARFSAADATSGLGIELNVVAACVIGGVAIAGGVGSAVGAVIGACLLQTIALSLGALGVSQFWQQAVNGLLLLSAITLDRIIASRTTATRTVRAKAVKA